MSLGLLKLHDPSMFAAARGRIGSINWRLGQGYVFATGASLVLNSFLIGLIWLAVLCGAMLLDCELGKRYLKAASDREREAYGVLFILANAATVAAYASMAIWLPLHGGEAGRVLSVLISASSLISVMLFLFQAPVFMLITAVPCTVCLVIIPMLPQSESPTTVLYGSLGIACGVGSFLAYVVRAAVNNGRMFRRMEQATRLAHERAEEAELKRAEAEAANRAKSEFLTTMTHELRTPLNAVIGYSEIIEEDTSALGRADLARDATRITLSARHLLSLIDDILQLSTMDSGASHAVVSDVDVREVLDAEIVKVADIAQSHGNRIALHVDPAGCAAHTDREKLALCVGQLLSNAAKFTNNGLVGVTAECEGEGERAMLRIAISDTGAGMSQEQIAKAFQPFTQIDGSVTRARGGIGLGLNIAARAASIIGGEISVASEIGKGSTFVIRVPLRLAQHESSEHPIEAAAA